MKKKLGGNPRHQALKYHGGTKPPPKRAYFAWVFCIIWHYLKGIDYFHTNLGK